jgi:hypothetical protein
MLGWPGFSDPPLALKRQMEDRLAPLLVLGSVLGALGCDPVGDLGAPRIGGSWTFSAANLQDVERDGITCSASGYRLVIDQNGTRFTGTYDRGRLTCVLQGATILDTLETGMIVNGSVVEGDLFQGGGLHFDFDTSDVAGRRSPRHQSGCACWSGMSGSASWRVDVGGNTGSVTVSGVWRAER